MANYGYEAAQTIKTRQKQAVKPTPQTVIIALSATAFDEDRVLMLASGCDDFVSKPFKRIGDKLRLRNICQAGVKNM